MRVARAAHCPDVCEGGRAVDGRALNLESGPTLLDAAGAGAPPTMQGRSLLPLLRGEAPDWRTEFVYEYMWGPTEFSATGNLLDFDVTNRLHEIDVPVLFIAGQFDEARPERVAEFQKLIPGSKLTIILDAAHSTLSKKPNEYRNVVETFLDSVEGNKK